MRRGSFAARAAAVAVLAASIAAGCAGTLPPGVLTRCPPDVPVARCPPPLAGESLELTYLGSGGVLVRWRGDQVMTGPFVSNFSVGRLALSYLGVPLWSNRDRLCEHLPPLDGVGAVLVGHAHYDHLLDTLAVLAAGPGEGVPRAPHAVLWGGTTVRRLAVSRLAACDGYEPGGGAGGGEPCRVRDFAAAAADAEQPGRWLRVGRQVRALAVKSEHAPHFGRIKLFRGEVAGDRKRPPRRVGGWKEGQAYSFLVDLLAPGGIAPEVPFGAPGPRRQPRVAARLFYQDAASTFPLGLPPASRLAGHRVDVALLCVASFDLVPGYPEEILRRLRPRRVVLIHWEDFFRSPDRPPKVVRLTDLGRFLERMEAAVPGVEWYLPAPGTTLRLPLGEAAAEG